jgi:hypothetical protein
MRLPPAQLPHDGALSPWLGVAAACIAFLLTLLVLRARRRREAQQTQRLVRHGLDPHLQELMRELSAMIESAGTQLDARAERLRALIRTADERIEQLRQEQSAAASNRPGRDVTGQDADNDASRESAPYVRPDAAAPGAEMADPPHTQIYALCADGLSPQQIADRTGRPKGEVELILALRPRNRAAV